MKTNQTRIVLYDKQGVPLMLPATSPLFPIQTYAIECLRSLSGLFRQNDVFVDDCEALMREASAILWIQAGVEVTRGKLKNGKRVVIYNCERLKMAKDLSFKGFINVNLGEEDKAGFADWYYEFGDALWDKVAEFLLQGHTLKLHWDSKSECFLLMMFTVEKSLPHFGHAMSSRSRDFKEVYALCMYKHFKLCGGDWTVYDTNPRKFNWG